MHRKLVVWWTGALYVVLLTGVVQVWVGLCSKMEVNCVHFVNRWSKVDGECFCVVTGGRL
jgi:hypothetical protein